MMPVPDEACSSHLVSGPLTASLETPHLIETLGSPPPGEALPVAPTASGGVSSLTRAPGTHVLAEFPSLNPSTPLN